MFRVITCIVLLLSLVTLSGMGATASALACSGAVEACCGGGEVPDRGPEHAEGGGRGHGPEHELDRGDACFSPGCLCIFCLPDDLTTPPSIGLPPNISGIAPGPPSHIPPTDFVGSIEYPPEAT